MQQLSVKEQLEACQSAAVELGCREKSAEAYIRDVVDAVEREYQTRLSAEALLKWADTFSRHADVFRAIAAERETSAQRILDAALLRQRPKKRRKAKSDEHAC